MNEPPLFDVLSPETEVFKNYFLEASAGSGKTFAIENLYVRLILEENNIDFRSILVMTFTKKGVFDLKKRIRSHLKRVLHQLRRKELLIPYLKRWEGNEKKAVEKVAKALLFFEESAIFTLHGFCYSLLKELGILSKERILNIPKTDEIAPLFRRHLKEMNSLSKAEIKRLKSVSNLAEGALQNAFRPRAWPKQPSFLEMRSALGFSNAPLEDEIRGFFPHLDRRTQKEALFYRFAHAVTSLDEDPFNRDDWESIQKMCRKKSYKKSIEEYAWRHYPDFFQRCEAHLFPYIEKKRSLSHLIAHFYQEVKERLAATKEREGWFFYDDLIGTLNSLLDDPVQLEKVQSRFKVAIVDEFQDTDSLQWSIIKKIFGRKEARMVLVGDPKQAIYSFRGADVYTYLEAKRWLGEEVVATLHTNYRSHPELVEAQNRLLGKSFLNLPKWGEELAFLPARSGKKGEKIELDGKGTLHFVFPEVDFKSANIESFVLPFLAHEIKSLKSLQVPLEEIAILVDTRNEGEKIKRGLGSFGIESELLTPSDLSKTPLADLIYEMLKQALFNPETIDPVKKVAWLLFGFSEKELLLFEDLEIRAKIVDRFQSLKHLFDKSQALFFEELFDCALLSEHAPLRVRLASSSEGRLLLEEWEEMCLRRSTIQDEEEGLSLPSRQERSPVGKIPILTLHGSKGLEFKVVFAVGLLSGRAHGVWLENLDLSEEVRHQELTEERLRLLYVGLTRAKTRLYLPIYKSRIASPLRLLLERKGLAFEKEPLIEFCKEEGYSYEIFSPSFEKQEEEGRLALSFIEPPVIAEKRIPFLSFTALHAKAGRAPLITKTSEKNEGGLFLGIILHEILEKVPISDDPLLIRAKVEERIQYTPFADRGDEIASWIERAISAPFLPGGKMLLEVKRDKILREAPFLFSENGMLFRGSLDLVGSVEGKFFIVDWKSHLLSEETDLSEWVLSSGYLAQAELYKKSAHQYLNFMGIEEEPYFIFYFLRSGRWWRCH